MKNNIIRLIYIVLAPFIILSLYLGYLHLFQGSFLATHPKNPRVIELEKLVNRGKILDREGLILAESVDTNGLTIRRYPYGETFAHVVGYVSDKRIKTGLEASYNDVLLGLTKKPSLKNYLAKLQGKPNEGFNLVTTLDSELQVLGQQLLGGKRGAIVALRPQTNEVLALVSAPSFDPNQLKANWASLNADEAQKPLLNRATQGLYPPGSILKIMTGAGALEKDPELKEIFYCPGYIQVRNYKLNDTAVHGKIDFERAMAVSCNTTFATLGLSLGSEEFYNTALKVGFLKSLDFDLGVNKSFIPAASELPVEDLAQSAIGQGKILATPLHMALLASVIANNGKMIEPSLITQVQTNAREVIEEIKPKEGQQVFSEATVGRIRNAMVKVVTEGTGKNAQIKGVEVAGKTGTAENPHGDPHSWFVGFAPAQNPQIVVAILVENGGQGGKEAAVMAKAIIERALKD